MILYSKIAVNFPLLRSLVFEIFIENLQRPYESVSPLIAIEIRKKYMDLIIFLVKLDYAMPVLKYLKNQTDYIDDVLLIYFLKEVFPFF